MHSLTVLGRLKDGVTIDAASANMTALAQGIAAADNDQQSRYVRGGRARPAGRGRPPGIAGAAGYGRLRAADRVRERREPAARARLGAARRDGDALGARRRPPALDSSIADRERVARGGGQRARHGGGVVGARPARARQSSRSAARRSGGHRHDRAAVRHRGRATGRCGIRRGAGAAGVGRESRRCDAGEPRAPPARTIGAGRRGSGAVADAARWRRPDDPQLRQAAESRSRVQVRECADGADLSAGDAVSDRSRAISDPYAGRHARNCRSQRRSMRG